MLRRTCLLIAVLAGVWSVAAASAAADLRIDASLRTTGWIDLRVTGDAGAAVEVAEVAGARSEPVASLTLGEQGRAVRRKAVPWRCGRATRRFVAAAGDQRDTVTVRTQTCRERLAIALEPFSPRARRPIRVRVRDHWRLGGVAARVCVKSRTRRARRCRTVTLRPGQRVLTRAIRAPKAGLATVTARAPWGQTVRKVVDVRSRKRKLEILATGDSMIQIVDSFLQQRLRPRGVAVRSDARISTGISKPFQLDWVALARRQAATRHPNVTVVFIGANDGFAIGGVQCCGRRWIRGYTRRVRRMIASWQRGGAGRVYWLTLPRPRPAKFGKVFRAVNTALRLAEPQLRASGRLIDMGRVFTPGGRFRPGVRQADGVHLNTRGASIAARVIIRVLRRDGVL